MFCSLNRRTLLKQLSALAAVSSLPLSTRTDAAPGRVSPHAELINKRQAYLTGGALAARPEMESARAVLVVRAQHLLSTLIVAPSRRRLWPDASIFFFGYFRRDTGGMAITFQRLYQLALAWRVPGTQLSGDAVLREKLVSALTLAIEIFARRQVRGNWWQFEIGVPRDGMNILYLLGDAVPQTTREAFLEACRWYAPDPNYRGREKSTAETGANRADKAFITLMRGLLSGDEQEMQTGSAALSDRVNNGKNSVFQFVTRGDGFYEDGSFIQHDTLSYAGGYGLVVLNTVAEMLNLVAGTPWDIPVRDREFMAGRIRHAFAPFMWRGRMMDSVRGRYVARQFQKDYQSGFDLISATLSMAPSFAPAVTREMQTLAATWLKQSGHALYDDATRSIGDKSRVLAAQRAGIQAATLPPLTHFFADQERVVHRRAGWAFSVNLSSTRISRYEYINRENRHGWYQGDGMSFLYLRNDAEQFNDNFWPTVDPWLLPGITADSSGHLTSEDDAPYGAPLGGDPFSGGVTLTGGLAVVGMALVSASKETRAKKSWFLLDDAVVCIGSGISGCSGSPVRTVIENRGFAVSEPPQVSLDDQPFRGATALQQPVTHGMCIEGLGGYVLLGDQQAMVSYQQREGSWFDIYSDGNAVSRTPFRRDYLTLMLDHGVDPKSAGYAYMLLPGAHRQQVQSRREKPGLTLMAQTEQAHIVNLPAQSATLGLFYAPASAAGITSDAACAFAYSERKGELEVVVSSPARQPVIQLTLPLDYQQAQAVEQDAGITIVSHAPLTLRIDAQKRRGEALRLRLQR
ncbi:hypothetical protein CIG19_13085 [Enterobacterales bacterium CwR94]|nr:hypothetical protein CIG19_13085 [Enterobacterales bacterium CwR94]